jgi:hypothetical protein
MRVLSLVVAAAVGVVDVSGFANLGVPTLSARRSVLSMAAESTDTTRNIKVGVIGCGRIGIVHLGAITKAPNVTPVIVSNPTISKAEKGEPRKYCIYCAFSCSVFYCAFVF